MATLNEQTWNMKVRVGFGLGTFGAIATGSRSVLASRRTRIRARGNAKTVQTGDQPP
jgi:hypothetical protein